MTRSPTEVVRAMLGVGLRREELAAGCGRGGGKFQNGEEFGFAERSAWISQSSTTAGFQICGNRDAHIAVYARTAEQMGIGRETPPDTCKGRLKSAAGERGGPKVRHPDRTGGCTAIWNNGPRFVDECW